MPGSIPHRLVVRRGFTTVELLVAIVLIGILTAIATPRFTLWRQRSAVTAARQHVEASLATARAAVVQRGTSGAFLARGNTLSAWALSPRTGDTVWVIPPTRLDSLLRVTLTTGSPGDSIVRFNSRGLANNGVGSIHRYILTSGPRRDSICVAPAGNILPRRCAL